MHLKMLLPPLRNKRGVGVNIMELKKKVVSGIGWGLGSSALTQGFNFLTKIIIARLLFPADLGIFAMAILVINFLSLFTGFGILSAVIYKKDDEEKARNTAFVIIVCLGLVLFVLGFLLSTSIASFFNQPVLVPMVRVLSLVFIFDALSSVFSCTLLKDMEYKRKTIAEILSVIVYTIVIITMAYAGFGVWSIIFGYISQHAAMVLLFFFAAKKKIQFAFDREIAKELLHFGKYSLSVGILAWTITSIDNIIVGKKLGDESLGYYSLGFNFAALPVLSVTHIITTVFHPVYARLQDDKDRLRQAYLKPLEWSLLFLLPISVGMFILADLLVIVVLGEKWIVMIPLLKIFAVYCILRTICTIASQLLEAVGKPKNAAFLLALELLILIPLLMMGVWIKGIIGVAIAVVIARGCSVILHIFQIQKILSLSFKEYWAILGKKVIAVVGMGVMVLVIRYLVQTNTFVTLFMLIGAGAFVYVILLFYFEKSVYREATVLIKGQLEK